MKIDGLTIETVKGKFARYGLSAEPGKMHIQPNGTDPFRGTTETYTIEEVRKYALEQMRAARVLLTNPQEA
jgi:hypothetical protein